MNELVLSLFPGIGLLDMAFEQEGFCVVRGPDLLWGGDIRRFHPPAGVFGGVIGGPPCPAFCGLANLQRGKGIEPAFGNLIPEFERVVSEAGPEWFVMENVAPAPRPSVPGYRLSAVLLNNRWLGEEQNRVRRFSFGTHDGRPLCVRPAALEALTWRSAVTAAHGGERRTHASKITGGKIVRYKLSEAMRLQGLVRGDELDHAPFTAAAKLKMVANGVPLPMGRAIAQAVRRALERQAAQQDVG